MMGTSLLAMPWALHQAGLVLGILLMLLMAGIAFYTAYRVVQSPQSLGKPRSLNACFVGLKGSSMGHYLFLPAVTQCSDACGDVLR